MAEKNDNASVKEVDKRKVGIPFLPFLYFCLVNAVTEEDETIRGGSLFLFGKQVITISKSSSEWVREDGSPYGFFFEDKILFLWYYCVGFGKVKSED